jgi:hypothetical protein
MTRTWPKSRLGARNQRRFFSDADGDFIHRQDAKPVKIRPAIVGFQILLVDVLDRFPVQLKVPAT